MTRTGQLPIASRGTTSVAPSVGQEGLWFLDRVGAAGLSYFVCWTHRFQGRLDTDALIHSVDYVIARHDALRTVFHEVGGNCQAQVLSALKLTIPIIDLSHESLEAAQREVERRCHADLEQRFDLAQGPLIRCLLFRIRPDDHVLFVNIHHIVFDGTSAVVFRQEMLECYRTLAVGQKPNLPTLPGQFGNYAMQQRERLSGEKEAELLAYWRNKLDGCEPHLYLPADRQPPAALTYASGSIPFGLSPKLLQQLRGLARAHKVSVFVILLAAFQTLLMRMSHCRDIVVGTPFSGRGFIGAESMIGYFVNMLPLRVDLDGNPLFTELLPRIMDGVMQAMAHEALPFPKLVAALAPQHDRECPPFFRVVLNVQHSDCMPLELPGIVQHIEQPPPLNTTHALSLCLWIGPHEAAGRIDFARDVFEEETVRQVSARFRRLLECVAADAEQPIEDLPLLLPGEKDTLLNKWNATRRDIPATPMHVVIAEQARRTPQRVALVVENQRVTYGELEAEAERVAAHLVEMGVGPDMPVGLFLDRSVPFVVGMLAILKAGGAYVPVDLENPPERTNRILQEGRIAIVLTVQALAARVVGPGRTIVLLDGHESMPTRNQPRHREGSLQDLAYILYTSGSSGMPKGVAVPHLALTNHMQWLCHCFHLTADDVVLQKTPVGFDASVWEFFAPLMVGGTLVIARPGGHRDPEYMANTIRQHGVTILQVVPTQLEMLVGAPAFAQCRTLRCVFCGGEALTTDLAKRFRNTLSIPLINLYGPTEACIDATFHVVHGNESGAIVPLGRPIDNLRCYVLDARRQPVPVGVPGELYLGGAGVARGYLNQPALTAERFLSDPFRAETGARMYRTGDCVQWRRDGTLAYLGRMDDQVKIRGVRVEPDEVGAILGRDPRVTACCVVARAGVGGQPMLVAYVVPAAVGVTAADLRAALMRQLPLVMVPARFIFLSALPLLPSGKVDRQALPISAEQEQTATLLEPRTDNERVLAGIWSRLLQRQAVGVNENFFNVGGHSLLATQLVAHVRQILHVEMPLRTIFERPTIEGQALYVLEKQAQAAPGDIAALLNEVEQWKGDATSGIA